MAAYDDYVVLLNSRPENETYYECIVLSHSLFSKTYYLVNDTKDLTASLHTGQSVLFEKSNMAPFRPINSNDLDQLASFTIGDVNNTLDDEMDRIPLSNNENIICEYYVFHSEHLTENVNYISFNVDSVPQKKGVFTVKTGVTDLNNDNTGDIFDFERFPMLRTL